MDKVIVYGLGKDFIDYRTRIEDSYDIIGYCDKDERKVKGEKAIRIGNLRDAVANCDYILVTSRRYSVDILEDLKSLGIPEIKVRLYFYQKEAMPIWGGHMPILGVSYSANMEDYLIAEMCNRLNLSVSGLRYIELGTCDPIYGNNTFWFYEHGGSGILVEAIPKLCKLIQQIRPNDIVLNRAVYAGNEKIIPFYVSNNMGLSSIYESHTQESEDWMKFGIKEEIMIQTIHINEVFEMLEDDCDLLSIDLEGYDLEALRSLDFQQYRPKIIVSELTWCVSKNQHDVYAGIVTYLYENNYVLYAQNEFNGIFCDKRLLK